MVVEVLDFNDAVKTAQHFLESNAKPNLYFVPDEDILKGYLVFEMFDNARPGDVRRIEFPVSDVGYAPVFGVDTDKELQELILKTSDIIGFSLSGNCLLYDITNDFSYRVGAWENYSEELTIKFKAFFSGVMERTNEYLNSKFFSNLKF